MDKNTYREEVVKNLNDIADSIAYIAANKNKERTTEKDSEPEPFIFLDNVDVEKIADAVKVFGGWLKK